MHLARVIDSAHGEGVYGIDLGAGEPLSQVARVVVVGEEADGAAVHAVDRDAIVHVPVQRLQHQPVAAERDDGIGLLRGDVAVQLRQGRKRAPGFRHLTGNKGDLLEFLRLSLAI